MNCDCSRQCNKCDRRCNCPEPFLGIFEYDNEPGYVTFNIDGKEARWDGRHLVQSQQTDTSLIVDLIHRLLKFKAERHTDTISAKELGAILHLSDLGDVDGRHLEQGSLLTYKKNNDCAQGCVGTRNTWEVWNALDGKASNAYYPIATDDKGNLASIEAPANPNKTYFLGWNGKSQLSYFGVPLAATKPVNGGAVYFDEDSGQLVYVKG